MTKIPRPEGFNGRVFLTKAEWLTYRKRKPVRNIRKKHSSTCFHCGKKATKADPFQHSHRIGFSMGVLQLGLTPDYLDRGENIHSAHRIKCNKAVEHTYGQAVAELTHHGLELPEYIKEQKYD